MNSREIILDLIRICAAVEKTTDGSVSEPIATGINRALAEIEPADFLKSIIEDPNYASYYYEVMESGACAKPREIAALVLEAIAVDAVESRKIGTEEDKCHR